MDDSVDLENYQQPRPNANNANNGEVRRLEQAAAPRPEVVERDVCGFLRLRRNGNIDLCCLKDIEKDCLWMVIFVGFCSVTVCLVAALT